MTAAASQPQSQHKPDNLLGICNAIGEDLGFNPNWLRVALGMGILWNPAAVLGAYLAMGIVVLVTRWMFPDRKPVAEQAAEQPAVPLPDAANEATEYARAA